MDDHVLKFFSNDSPADPSEFVASLEVHPAKTDN